MNLSEAYLSRDHDHLSIGDAALLELQSRAAEEERAGIGAPSRVILSGLLDELSLEYASYHASRNACRAYLRDGIRIIRYFTPDRRAELKPYLLTFAHMRACCVGGKWPDVDETATGELLNWTIQTGASPEDIWGKRRGEGEPEEQKAWRRVEKSVEHYLDVSVSDMREIVEARRKACREFATIKFSDFEALSANGETALNGEKCRIAKGDFRHVYNGAYTE